MLVVSFALLLIVLVAGAVVAVVASSSDEAEGNPWAQKVRSAVPQLPVIREDEDLHLRR